MPGTLCIECDINHDIRSVSTSRRFHRNPRLSATSVGNYSVRNADKAARRQSNQTPIAQVSIDKAPNSCDNSARRIAMLKVIPGQTIEANNYE